MRSSSPRPATLPYTPCEESREAGSDDGHGRGCEQLLYMRDQESSSLPPSSPSLHLSLTSSPCGRCCSPAGGCGWRQARCPARCRWPS
eukprot:767330-Hanusia_phi.AAC.13